MGQAIRSSQAGHGFDTFAVAAQFRHGPQHPAQIAPQRLEVAREWFQRCLREEGCPTLALASLAEIDLDLGQRDAALTWAVAYGWVDAEFARRAKLKGAVRNQYAQQLVTALLHDVPPDQRQARVTEAIAAARAGFGDVLEAMVTRELATLDAQSDQTFPTVVKRRAPRFDAAVLNAGRGLYLLQLQQEGGAPQGMALIEVVPDVDSAQYLKLAMQRMEYSRLPDPDVAVVIAPAALDVQVPIDDVRFE